MCMSTRPFVCTTVLFSFIAGTTLAGEPALQFSNQTTQAGLDSTNDFSPAQSYTPMSGAGLAADFNNDGYDDIFQLGSLLPNNLFINNQDGTFTNQAVDWGISGPFHSFAASAADFNNDGYIDIYITAFGPADEDPQAGKHMLMMNNGPDKNGQWSFTDIAESAGVNHLAPGTNRKEGTGSGWGDYDLDGDLDLFVCAYGFTTNTNRLFRNDGPDKNGIWRFTDVTAQAGLEQTGLSGFLPSFVDMNKDRYPELMIVGDTGTSKYYINNQDGTFTDQTIIARGMETANGMGIDVGDVNNDGLLDMYITSITYPTTQGPGNVLLIHNQDHSYDNTARDNGTYAGHWGWGTLFVDLDHDADLDIVETNGFLGTFAGDPAVIFENTNAGVEFNEVAAESGFIHTKQGRGMVRMDIENDGDLDIVIFNNNSNLSLFRNEIITGTTPADRSWIRIQLDTAARDSLAPHGIGAMVKVITGNQTQLLPMHCGASYASTSPIEVHAGLADATTIDTIRIEWPDGSFTTRTNVDVNQILTIDAPAHPADYTDDGMVTADDVFSFLKTFSASSLVADHNGDMALNFFDISTFLADYRSAMAP